MPEFLDEVKRQVDTSIREAIDGLSEKLDRKLASVENRMEKLEGQLFYREHRMDDLSSMCCAQDERIKELEMQIEEMERHSRGANLILCRVGCITRQKLPQSNYLTPHFVPFREETSVTSQ